MIDGTLDSTKGEPMSHHDTSERKYTVDIALWSIAIILFGLVIQLWRDDVMRPDTEAGHATVSSTIPVQSYGPGDTGSIEDFYAKLLAPKDQPDDCQPSTGEPVADLMLGINAC